MSKKIASILIIMLAGLIFKGCTPRSKMVQISMAQKEASKKNTKPEPNTIIKDKEPEIIDIEDVVNPKEKKIINSSLINNKIPPAEGKLIQVEGLVLKELTELNIKLNTSGSQISQIMAIKTYVNSNWHYIFDPDNGHDTWRSAEATLSLKYKGQYSGDCDDFAILMASFARQIGLRSRMVAGFKRDLGHAFAEFLVPDYEQNNVNLNDVDSRDDFEGRWISLDWFKGKDHEEYTSSIKVFEDI
jgi:predicted transglutaminase-like cysteine proteinase